MHVDLLTILVVRLFVDLLVTAAFVAQSRRHPSVGGPGWWTMAGLCSTLGTLGMGWLGHRPEWAASALAHTALSGSALFFWGGLRSHLGLHPPWRGVTVALALLLSAQLLIGFWWSSVAAAQALLAAVSALAGLASLGDLRRFDPERHSHALQVLRGVVWLEMLLVVGVAFAVWWSPDTEAWEQLRLWVPSLLMVTLLNIVLRLVIATALVTSRLQRDSDRARQVLQMREQDSRALIANLSAGVMVFRPDQTLASINSAARRFLGWGPGGANAALPEPAGAGWKLLREDGQPMDSHEMPFERVRDSGQGLADLVVGMPVGDGSAVRWALCNAYPEKNVRGQLRHVVLTFVDISSLRSAKAEQLALQAQLAQSQKMEALGTLAGGVAHDFNNILAAILGNADLARQDLPPFHRARESLHEITTAARRGRELVRQIMAFSRRQPMVRAPVHMGDVLSESCSLLRPAVPPQVELVQQCPRHVRPILADATQLGQVLLNLGTNAIHALQGRAGSVALLVDELPAGDPALPADWAALNPGGAVRVRVRDNGCGMDEATRSRIFEPFFTTKAVGSGTGLGLPVVLGIVQSLGGAIEVQTAPGEGTTFSLFFALAEPAPPLRPAIGPESAAEAAAGLTMTVTDTIETHEPPEIDTMVEDTATTQRHVLYLDDDDTLVFLVRRLLERRGYRVTGFSEQNAAIDAVRQDPGGFHLLLTDYNMPGMSGLDVAKAVLAINPQLPVAVASGYITDELQAEALAAGVVEVVFKTDAVEAFCEVVARLVKPALPT